LQAPVEVFCYPNGGPADYSDTVVSEVESAGYLSAYLAFPPEMAEQTLYTLARVNAPPQKTEFQWILCGAAHLERVVKKALGLATGPGSSYWMGARAELHSAEISDAAAESGPEQSRVRTRECGRSKDAAAWEAQD
jgi:hypothetical protein